MYSLLITIFGGKKKTILITVSILIAIIMVVFLYILMKDPPGIVAGIEDMSVTYTQLPVPIEKTKSTTDYLLPTDTIEVGKDNKKILSKEFDNVFVKKGVLTDCSFTSAFMLMYEHDPDYPFKVIKTSQDGSYVVKFPGHNEEIPVTETDIAKFNSYINEKKTWKSYFHDSHSVYGIDLLRNAYYGYRRKREGGIGKYRVYGGGVPIDDLLMLSGIENGYVIKAVQEAVGSSFSDGNEIRLEVNLKNGVKTSILKDGPKEFGNPLDYLADLWKYMVAFSSAKIVDNSFGSNIIASHAYYLKGMTSDGMYVLGNSYNTKNIILLDEVELLKKFAAIHYIQIYE
jgi:hypothetical protein